MIIGSCYIRVSTDEQLEYSPTAQLKAIQSYAERNGISIDERFIFKDEGFSGKRAEKRPAFMSMIAAAKQKPRPFDVILVHRFDRFARNREDSVVYKSLLRRECGIRVISITEQLEDDKFSVILESMLEAMAEYYSLNLADEVKKGMLEKAERGECQSCSPLGYKKNSDEKYLTAAPEEMEIVKYIFEEFLSGSHITAIARNLNKMGCRSRKGNLLERRAVKYILRNPVYKGYHRWNTDGRFENNPNPSVIIAKSKHKPVVSEEMFEQVQRRLDNIEKTCLKNQRPAEEYKHWLSSLLKCGHCGSSLVRSGEYFQCGAYAKGKCMISHALRISNAERAVKRDLEKLIDLSVYERITEVKAVKSTDIYYYELNSIEKRLNKAKEAYLCGVDSIEEYKQSKAELIKRQEAVFERLRELESEKVENHKVFQYRSLSEILESDIDNIKKNNAIKALVYKIVYDKKANALIYYIWE